MARKIGTEFVKDMMDRGRRELGATLYADSNVAQPMYPLRGGYEPPSKDASRDDHGRNDKDIGLDKE